MDEKDSIEIRGQESKIEVSNVEDIKVKGDHNVIRVEGEDRDIEIKGSKNIIDIKEEEDIKKEFKTSIGKSFNFLKQKKVLNILIIVLFIFILITSVSIRTKNLHLLKDSTTGRYIPLALDPYYFLRISETMISGEGLSEYDPMRKPFEVSWSSEVLPLSIVFLYKLMNILGDYSLEFVDIISPVIFFVLALVVSYFLIYYLTRSKLGALIGSAFLAFIPSFLYRTMAGFADHESLGILAFFLVILAYTFALNFLNKNNQTLKKAVLYGLFVGLLTTFTIVSWGGVANFVFMIIPIGFFIFWIIKYKIPIQKEMVNSLGFYIAWIIFGSFFTIFFGYNILNTVSRFMMGTSGIGSLAVLIFIIIDYFLVFKKFRKIKEHFRTLYSFGITIILGILGLILIGKNPFTILVDIFRGLLYPFGLQRVSLTVAENAQPYLMEWIIQMGGVLFWFFYLGCIFIGIEIAKSIKKRLSKVFFIFLWILMISGILFSRISGDSIFNGSNFISQFFYFIGLLLFSIYFIRLIFKIK